MNKAEYEDWYENTEPVTLFRYIATIQQAAGAVLPDRLARVSETLQDNSTEHIFESTLKAILDVPGHPPVFHIGYEDDLSTPVLTWIELTPREWSGYTERAMLYKIQRFASGL